MPTNLDLASIRMQCIPELPPEGEKSGSGREVGVVELFSASGFARTSTALPATVHSGGIAVADCALVPGLVRTAIPQLVQMGGVDVAELTLAAGYARTPTPPARSACRSGCGVDVLGGPSLSSFVRRTPTPREEGAVSGRTQCVGIFVLAAR